MDDGKGGTRGFGYFIHIQNAPYWNYAKERLHEFHLIRTPNEYHICWNRIIDDFEQANAVMYVWVNRYADLLDVLKKDHTISDQELVKKANRKSILPVGTFRVKKNKKNYNKNHNNHHPKKTIHITTSVYNEIMKLLGKQKPELGGMLGFSMDQDYIDTFVFDFAAQVGYAEYNPNTEYLNNIINNEWDKNHIYLAGFVHSHPGNFNKLSYADIDYSKKIIDAFEMDYLFTPIVTSSYEYKSALTGYIVKKNGYVEHVNVQIVNDKINKNDKDEQTATNEDTINPDLLAMIEAGFDDMDKKHRSTIDDKSSADESIDPKLIALIEAGFDDMDREYNASIEKTVVEQGNSRDITDTNDVTIQTDHLDQNSTFARISGVIDINYMNDCAIIGIGCGGARGFYEDMARMGVGNFYLIDGDISSKSNIASQNGYISEIGKAKVDVVKNRLIDINDNCNVSALNFMLNDEITDEWFYDNILKNYPTEKTLICAFTDDFFAQARAQKLATKYNIPYLAAQHHEFGNTSELLYWYPNVTKYSSEEILKNRYESYAHGYKNNVTSVGSPIFNTTRLNALCEKIALGILLYANELNSNPVYSSFIRYEANRNLILIRQRDLSTCQSQLESVFCMHDGYLFDDVVWIDVESITEDTNSSTNE